MNAKPALATFLAAAALNGCQKREMPSGIKLPADLAPACDPYSPLIASPDGVPFCEELARQPEVRERLTRVLLEPYNPKQGILYTQKEIDAGTPQQPNRLRCRYAMPVTAASAELDHLPTVFADLFLDHAASLKMAVETQRRSVVSVCANEVDTKLGCGVCDHAFVGEEVSRNWRLSDWDRKRQGEFAPDGIADVTGQLCKQEERQKTQAEFADRMKQGRAFLASQKNMPRGVPRGKGKKTPR